MQPRLAGRCILLLAILPVHPVHAQAARASAAYASAVGVAGYITGQRLCLAIANGSVVPGTRIVLAWAPIAGTRDAPALLVAETQAPATGSCIGDSTFVSFAEYGDSLYPLTMVRGQASGGAFYFAVVAAPRDVTIRGSRLFTDLDGNGRLETYRACTSSEGVHLTIWAGEPLRSRRLWHRYAYLGYDVVPSCRPADYEGPE